MNKNTLIPNIPLINLANIIIEIAAAIATNSKNA
jgi:hypothetical protein